MAGSHADREMDAPYLVYMRGTRGTGCETRDLTEVHLVAFELPR